MNRKIAGTAPQGIASSEADLPGNFRGACPASLHATRNRAAEKLLCGEYRKTSRNNTWFRFDFRKKMIRTAMCTQFSLP
ncbi:MAG: hypothetical protein FWH57_12235 [Oscillospiraceae bacterium]|nr:hypothetical protein [Oscillospiraceae bacterium]